MGSTDTMSLEVKGSYPEALEAKLTPVEKSLGFKLGSRYAGNNSLIPSSSTAKLTLEKHELFCESSVAKMSLLAIIILSARHGTNIMN